MVVKRFQGLRAGGLCDTCYTSDGICLFAHDGSRQTVSSRGTAVASTTDAALLSPLTHLLLPPGVLRHRCEKKQNLLRSAKIQNALAAKGIDPSNAEAFGSSNDDEEEFGTFNPDQYSSDDLDDDQDDGSYTDDDDLRRKLNRLAGPGGAMEAESREAPHLFAPGGPLESPGMARAVGGSAAAAAGGFVGGGVFDSPSGGANAAMAAADLADLAKLEKEVAADVGDLSDVFSDVGAYSSDSMPRPPSVSEKEEEENQEEGTGGERLSCRFLAGAAALCGRPVCLQRAWV